MSWRLCTLLNLAEGKTEAREVKLCSQGHSAGRGAKVTQLGLPEPFGRERSRGRERGWEKVGDKEQETETQTD